MKKYYILGIGYNKKDDLKSCPYEVWLDMQQKKYPLVLLEGKGIGAVGGNFKPSEIIAPIWSEHLSYSGSEWLIPLCEMAKDDRDVLDLKLVLDTYKCIYGTLPPLREIAWRKKENDGKLVTLDNRRLATFEAAGIKDIPVQRVYLEDPKILAEFTKKKPLDDGTHTVVIPKRGRDEVFDLLREQDKIDWESRKIDAEVFSYLTDLDLVRWQRGTFTTFRRSMHF